ncbi:tyrosine-type recombinase/integrase [Thermodesulfobacteriota bacterium]
MDELRGKLRGLMGVRVRQKVKGKGKPWWVFVSHNGQRTSKRVGSKKAANEVAGKIEAKLKLGEFSFEDEKPVGTFREYAESWIKTTVPATCKHSTVREYRDILNNHIYPSPAFGNNQDIITITRGDIKTFLLGKLNDGYAVSTVAHLRNCLSGVFNLALDYEIVQTNPAQKLGKGFLQAENNKEDINPLTQEELKLLLSTVKKHFPAHHTLFLLLARTGMRIGEALALKWGDLDFNGRFVEVRRSYVRGRISTPKNKKGRRVDMSLQLAESLKTHELASKKKGLALGLGDMPEYVFTNQVGKLMDQGGWRKRVFKKAVKKAKLRAIRIHDLRHTYATLRISKGDNVADVSNQLGHHSVKFTWDVYYHWTPGKKKSEVDGLDDPDFLHPSAPYLHPAPSEKKKEVALNG